MAEAAPTAEVKVHNPYAGLDYGDVQFPVADFADAQPHLRRPFAPNAVKWKIQVAGPKSEDNKKWAIIVGYVDARLVAERLNLVVGGNWSERPMQVENGVLWYGLKVFDQEHVDVGAEQGDSASMKAKGMHSDALKRTAVRFGVGVPIYAMPQIFLDVAQEEHEQGGAPTIKRLSNGKPGSLRDVHFKYLRGRYERWLDEEGELAFGPYLDHGDSPESVGELAESAPETERQGPAQVQIQSHGGESTEPVVTAAMRKKLWAEISKAGLSKDEDEAKIRAILVWVTGNQHTDRIARSQFDEVLAAFKDPKATLQQIHDIAEDPEVDGHEVAKQIEQMLVEGSGE